VAVVRTLVTNKTTHKRNNPKTQYKQNTVNTSAHITKHPHIHTLQNQLKQPQYKIRTK
jgi:hypothetical protein